MIGVCTVGSQVASREAAHRADRRGGMLFWFGESCRPLLFKRLTVQPICIQHSHRAYYLLTQRAEPLYVGKNTHQSRSGVDV